MFLSPLPLEMSSQSDFLVCLFFVSFDPFFFWFNFLEWKRQWNEVIMIKQTRLVSPFIPTCWWSSMKPILCLWFFNFPPVFPLFLFLFSLLFPQISPAFLVSHLTSSGSLSHLPGWHSTNLMLMIFISNVVSTFWVLIEATRQGLNSVSKRNTFGERG